MSKESKSSKKFDVVIGNPPYQDEKIGTKKTALPVYHLFMEEAYSVGEHISFITPARFLFDAGATPKAWNRKMLDDKHLKIIDYRQNSGEFFEGVDITGGVVITYRSVTMKVKPIKLFIPHKELRTILSKVEEVNTLGWMNDIADASTIYKLSEVFHSENPKESEELPNKRIIATNIFERFPHIFKTLAATNRDVRFYGRQGNIRGYRWVEREYIEVAKSFDKWKVFVPHANGSKIIGEDSDTMVIGEPTLGEPLTGHTQTFISLGYFDHRLEAESCLKYIKSKFVRVLVGILKITPLTPPGVWSKVPLQDFTEDSDIDWSKSIPEIDQQLYEKYDLNEEEIAFIEDNIKEMD